ncbi:serine hydrolase domain-containing protein [Pengzhenrongella frigida]|uniref:Class A beta-lactamase-related serine hydrolase n=1 Tax=Pengzhenrongella frigida TaxID=1259133 RepID=A0A4Q5N3Q1_9MICO|nr:serine hydrolase domain-containing protein [Cellulomonas sp. HLT2-17]RYV52796.1 class A beta-lactamase-related serine hydrolase [Cellulomonas sp. HLT2-17]
MTSLVDDLRTYFADLDVRDGFPGVVLVTDGATTVYEGAFGLASRAWGVPNGIDTRFDTASITKLFTATAVLQMIDAGRLAFDTPVVAYLGLSDTTIAPDVTVRHLLTHTSGIGDDADEEAGEQYEDLWRDTPNYSVISTADFLPQFATKPANFAPGAGCRYNNVGYVLLGLCIERASGMSYRDYVRSRVFAPAGMDRSDFFRMDDVAPDVAEGADPVLDADGNIASWRRNIYSYPPVGSPDGGAHTTARDLERFLRAARSGRLFSARLTEQFLTPHALHSTTETAISRFGLGLEFVSDPNDDLMFVQKDGINAGTSALLRYYPGTDLTIVLLSNTSGGVWAPGRAIDAMVRARRAR